MKVFPVFYGVDPYHVRHQTGSFTLDKYQVPEMANKLEKWVEALTQIASIVGKNTATCENEALMIENIVEGISNQLYFMQPVIFSDLVVGTDDHMERLNPLLSMESEDEVRMIGIWGMGGIGKTTIAREHGVSYVRKKFLSTTLCLSKKSSVELGPQEIKASRIIITTRDRDLLNSCRVRIVYEVKCLDADAALKIFNQFAFEEGVPPEIYEKFSIRASWLAQGLPAAIEAYGLHFRGLTSLKEWDDALCRLIRAP
uniref:TIR domain-containing protein n=1 Tax=Brassica oleracea var. oleracea TaxID=109376 RepID=A0A0D3AQ71_BRAOL